MTWGREAGSPQKAGEGRPHDDWLLCSTSREQAVQTGEGAQKNSGVMSFRQRWFDKLPNDLNTLKKCHISGAEFDTQKTRQIPTHT